MNLKLMLVDSQDFLLASGARMCESCGCEKQVFKITSVSATRTLGRDYFGNTSIPPSALQSNSVVDVTHVEGLRPAWGTTSLNG